MVRRFWFPGWRSGMVAIGRQEEFPPTPGAKGRVCDNGSGGATGTPNIRRTHRPAEIRQPLGYDVGAVAIRTNWPEKQDRVWAPTPLRKRRRRMPHALPARLAGGGFSLGVAANVLGYGTALERISGSPRRRGPPGYIRPRNRLSRIHRPGPVSRARAGGLMFGGAEEKRHLPINCCLIDPPKRGAIRPGGPRRGGCALRASRDLSRTRRTASTYFGAQTYKAGRPYPGDGVSPGRERRRCVWKRNIKLKRHSGKRRKKKKQGRRNRIEVSRKYQRPFGDPRLSGWSGGRPHSVFLFGARAFRAGFLPTNGVRRVAFLEPFRKRQDRALANENPWPAVRARATFSSAGGDVHPPPTRLSSSGIAEARRKLGPGIGGLIKQRRNEPAPGPSTEVDRPEGIVSEQGRSPSNFSHV